MAKKMKERRQFDQAFKVKAVQMVTQEGQPIAKVARKLGIHANSLHLWRRKFGGKEKAAPVRKARPGAGQSEVEQLRRDLAAVTEERDILRKAISIVYAKVGG